MKKLMVLLVAFTAFSFQLKAQPAGDLPGDPGRTFEAGYSEGATEAIQLQISLGDYYNCSVDWIEWHSYNENSAGKIGTEVDYNDPGFKVPKVIWTIDNIPSVSQDASGILRIADLEQYQFDDDYSSGYYQGFLEHWYNSYN